MLSRVKTVCFSGINVISVDVEVHFAKGQPGITIVGLGDKAVKESIDRIRATLSTLGLILPPQRITINLAPADILKEGTHYDLPIILGILETMGIIPHNAVDNYIALGEVGLDGVGINGLPRGVVECHMGTAVRLVLMDRSGEHDGVASSTDLQPGNILLGLGVFHNGFDVLHRGLPRQYNLEGRTRLVVMNGGIGDVDTIKHRIVLLGDLEAIGNRCGVDDFTIVGQIQNDLC